MRRHEAILSTLAKEKHIEVSDLCKQLNVSAITIRKDLRLLENKGLQVRTHGGTSLENPYILEKAVIEKEKNSVEEKKGIAQEVANLNHENDSIILASSSQFKFAK